MENLKIRILVQHVQGADIVYLYNRESFDMLNIKKHEYDESQFIEIGSHIEFNEKKYVVKSVNFKMENALNEMNKGYGISLHSPTEQSDFNCQIGVFVDNI